jgi:hypothetical protein
MPVASTSRLRLTPPLARSVGFFPVFFPPERCFGHAPVHAQPRPVQPLQAIIFEQTSFPHFQKHPGDDPFLKAIMGCGTGTNACGIQRFPLATGPQDEENAVHTFAVGGAWPTAAKPMGVPMLGQHHLDFFPEVVGNAPIVGGDRDFHACASMIRQLVRISVQLHAFFIGPKGLFG